MSSFTTFDVFIYGGISPCNEARSIGLRSDSVSSSCVLHQIVSCHVVSCGINQSINQSKWSGTPHVLWYCSNESKEKEATIKIAGRSRAVALTWNHTVLRPSSGVLFRRKEHGCHIWSKWRHCEDEGSLSKIAWVLKVFFVNENWC